MRKAKRRALVVGGSMSGLLAALLLRHAGWEVDVFERVERELAGRGAGIVAQPDLILESRSRPEKSSIRPVAWPANSRAPRC
jgi:monoamine oxidase